MNPPRPLEVLYSDNHLLAVNKPPGLLTQPSGTERDNLEDQAKAWVKEQTGKPGAVYLHAVHRLDRPVSGVVLFARTGKALSRLNADMRARSFRKLYHAVTSAAPAADQGELVHWLVHARYQAQVVEAGHPDAREARLRYRVLRRSSGMTLLEVDLQTGRYHQIRAQLAAAGWPILGDHRYGGGRRADWGDAIALHHARLQVTHPVRREPFWVEAPKPPHWPVAPPA